MKVLLLWPILPDSFWSYQEMIDLQGLKTNSPPLGLMTVAALLPQNWKMRLADRNARPETEADWEWCDLVIISAMLVQKNDFCGLIEKGVRLGKKVAVGGPLPTSVPDVAKQAGAHYLILDEGENTIPQFLAALERGEETGIFRSTEKPDVTLTPLPRLDLVNLEDYLTVTIQFSRGCPFQCEFCDIIKLYGRKSRTKTPEQMLAEFEQLYQTGWRRMVFLVDDNFIGNKRNAKLFLQALIPWMQERDYPFILITEASLNLAEDEELIDLMVQAGIRSVFMGIETPDVDSLMVANKAQNTRNSLIESCHKITRAGIQIMSGFILGFDGEKPGAGQRIVKFVEETNIPIAQLGMLTALHNTDMWERLKREGRLLEDWLTTQQSVDDKILSPQKALMNFVPTRPVEEIASEFIEAFWALFEPMNFLKRTYRHYMMMDENRVCAPQKRTVSSQEFKSFLAVCWRQGVVRSTRLQFWWQLVSMALKKPKLFYEYTGVLLAGEHFFKFRHEVRQELEQQIAAIKQAKLSQDEQPGPSQRPVTVGTAVE
ncbi:MAG: B12-binding domain-containing radical SAM protein [Elainella sp.]